MAYLISIDPGIKGGIAFWDKNGSLLSVEPMPTYKTSKKKVDLDLQTLQKLLSQGEVIVIERVHSMPKQGVASTFFFGKQFGVLVGMSYALGKKVDFISPQKWKKVVGLKAKTKKEGKRKAIEMVKEIYNIETKNDGIADAILIGRAFFILNKEGI